MDLTEELRSQVTALKTETEKNVEENKADELLSTANIDFMTTRDKFREIDKEASKTQASIQEIDLKTKELSSKRVDAIETTQKEMAVLRFVNFPNLKALSFFFFLRSTLKLYNNISNLIWDYDSEQVKGSQALLSSFLDHLRLFL